MKALCFVTTLLISMSTFASGKLIFQPYKADGAKENSVLLGLSVYQKFSGPFAWVHFTGLNADRVVGSEHKLSDIYFENGLKFQPMSRFSVEGGLKLHKDVEAKSPIADTVYVKVTAQLW